MYSAISVKMDSLPGNTKNRESTRSWPIRVRFLHAWAARPGPHILRIIRPGRVSFVSCGLHQLWLCASSYWRLTVVESKRVFWYKLRRAAPGYLCRAGFFFKWKKICMNSGWLRAAAPNRLPRAPQWFFSLDWHLYLPRSGSTSPVFRHSLHELKLTLPRTLSLRRRF